MDQVLAPKLHAAEMPFPAVWDPKQYGALYLLSGLDEDAVQEQIVNGIGQAGLELWPVDSGAKQARAQVQRVLRGAGAQDLARAAGRVQGASTLPVGHSDLSGCLAPAGRAVYLEVKRPAQVIKGKVTKAAGVPTQDQLAFLLARHREGALVSVVWSLGDALRILGGPIHFHRIALSGSNRG